MVRSSIHPSINNERNLERVVKEVWTFTIIIIIIIEMNITQHDTIQYNTREMVPSAYHGHMTGMEKTK